MSGTEDSLGGADRGDAAEAVRLAEECARSARQSAANSLEAIERAEGSLRCSEDRMAEVAAAAVVAAGEATEAKLRATEIASEFRALEEQVAEALRMTVTDRRSNGHAEPEITIRRTAPPADHVGNGSGLHVHGEDIRSAPAGVDDAWASFDRKADRIVEQLKRLEARATTVRVPARRSRATAER